MNNEDLVDYSTMGFTMEVIAAGVKTYASIHAKMYPEEDGLDFTGDYFVYLLHPQNGSCYFNLEYDHELVKWITRDAPAWVENELILKMADLIASRSM